MAQLGKLSGTVQLANGNADSGATVTIRKQGAFVTSTQAGPAYTVNDPGGIIVGDICVANTTTSPTRTASAVTATGVTLGAIGLGTLNNNDRISPTTAVTLYNDAQQTETKTNPVTTNASGYWYAWVPIEPYDIIIQKSDGSGKVIKYDVLPEGQELVESNIFPQAASAAYRRGVTRTHTQGRLATWENPTNTIKVEFDWNGDIISQGDLTVVDITASGNVNITGDLTVDDITCDDLTVNDIINGTSFTYSGTTGNFSLTAGTIETADLAANAVTTTHTGNGTADATASAAAAYNSANYQDVAGATVTINPVASTDELFVEGIIHTENNGAGYAGYVALRDGSGNILSEGGFTDAAVTTGLTVTTSVIYRVTGLTGSNTFKLSHQCVSGTAYDVNDSTHAAKLRISRVVVVRHRK